LSLCLPSVKKRAIYHSMEYTYEGGMIRLISTRVRQEAKIKKKIDLLFNITTFWLDTLGSTTF
jgi:hypothetical protein